MKKKLVYLFLSALLLLCAAGIIKNISPEPETAAEQQKGTEEKGTGEEKWSRESEWDKYPDGIPRVMITMEGEEEPRLRIRKWAKLQIYDGDHDTKGREINAQIWIRGQSSANYSKKQYGLDFYEEMGGSKAEKVDVMGMREGSDWVLNAPYYDQSLIRNVLMYGVARELTEWAPDTRFCEVWLEGEYQGLYVMIENVKVTQNRLDLYDYGFSTGETAYLVLRDRNGKEKNEIISYASHTGESSGTLYVEYPSRIRLTDDQKQWIEKDISKFERLLYMDGTGNEYMDMIDLDSFVDYYIINEFSMNRDAGSFSTYCYKDMKGKLCMGPVWDFNNTFNNYVEYLYEESFIVSGNNWFRELMEDREFVDAVVERYKELRQGILSEAALYERIDTYVEILGDAPLRNQERWPYHVLKTDDRKKADFEEAVAYLKDCIHTRGRWLDENIEQLYYYCR